MTMAVHANLNQCLGNSKTAPRNEWRLQNEGEALFPCLGQPLQLLCVGFLVLSHDLVDRLRNSGFFFFGEQAAQDQEKPESVGQNDVMEKFADFPILSGSFIVSNRSYQASICISLMVDKVLQHREHAENSNKKDPINKQKIVDGYAAWIDVEKSAYHHYLRLR
jgi:hypothetical protein